MRRFEAWFRAHQGRLWLITVVLLFALGLLAAAPRPAPTRWEYKVVKVWVESDKSIAKSETEMSQLGQAGWRYVGMTTKQHDAYVVVLERQR